MKVTPKMWFYIIFSNILVLTTFQVFEVNCNQSVSNWEQNLLTGLQMISNNSLNSSLMESQIQDQNSLSNTSLTDLQNDNNTQRLQIRFRER